MTMGDALALQNEQSAWAVMLSQATALVKSGFLPKAVRTPDQALALMQTGRELGLGPMQSIRSIHVIEGKPTLAAELMAALVFRHLPGAKLRVSVSTNQLCEVMAARPGDPETRFQFTLQDAQAAGLTGKGNWRTYPRAMLRSRCVAEACRAIFPDATMGLYTPDELGGDEHEGATFVELKPVNLEPEIAEAITEPAPPPSVPPQRLAEEAWRFKSGEYQGELITTVPTEYLSRLGKRTLNAAMRARVDGELERRNSDPDYIARKLQESLDLEAKKLEQDGGELPKSWGGTGEDKKSECPECEQYDPLCAMCHGTGRVAGVQT
jgi:hypothetical protein